MKEYYGDSERKFEGIYIPCSVWENANLSWAEKIIFFEIKSLDKSDTHCHASNEYISKFVHCSEKTVSRAINKFKKYGIINILNFDGRRRVIAVSADWEERMLNIEPDNEA